MNNTTIEGTGKTWNPITGCTQYSRGCDNCYAKKIALKLQKQGAKKYRNGFDITLHEDILSEPRQGGKSELIFTCSMSDLFHKDVPSEFIDKVMEVIASTPWHTYQILTKRAKRMADYFSTRNVPKNVGLGVTVEAAYVKPRVDYLRSIDASIKFLSCEPLVEDLGGLDLTDIHWVIVGGENAYIDKARPMKEQGVLSIKEQVDKQGASFFFKQGGSFGNDGIGRRNVEDNGSELKGKTYKAMPTINRHTLFG